MCGLFNQRRFYPSGLAFLVTQLFAECQRERSFSSLRNIEANNPGIVNPHFMPGILLGTRCDGIHEGSTDQTMPGLIFHFRYGDAQSISTAI